MSAGEKGGEQGEERPAEVFSVRWSIGEPEIPLPPELEQRGWECEAAVKAESRLPAGVAEGSDVAFIFRHPREAACVLRTLMGEVGRLEGGAAGVVSPQAAVEAVIGLGREVGVRVLQHLEEGEADSLIEGVAGTPQTDHRTAVRALALVRQRIEAGDFAEAGGVPYARRLLAGLGREGELGRILRQAGEPEERSGTTALADLLRGLVPEQLAPIVAREHPQTIALILSQLEAAQAAGILVHLSERMQADVAYRLATMENVAAQAIEYLGERLEQVLAGMQGDNLDAGGFQVVADMLNLTGTSVEKNALGQMEAQDPEVAEAVRERQFLFEDIFKLSDREIQTLLRELDQKDLVVSLKGASAPVKEKILSNTSERVRIFITEEMEFLGPMRLSEVEWVQLRITRKVRQLEEQGQLTIVRGGGDQFV